jgi:hypothetical protein
MRTIQRKLLTIDVDDDRPIKSNIKLLYDRYDLAINDKVLLFGNYLLTEFRKMTDMLFDRFKR